MFRCVWEQQHEQTASHEAGGKQYQTTGKAVGGGLDQPHRVGS